MIDPTELVHRGPLTNLILSSVRPRFRSEAAENSGGQGMAEARQAEANRVVPVGDLDAVCTVLAERYDEIGEVIYRMGDMELTYGWLSDWVQMARESHRDWLAEAFAPWLPARGREREDRLMCLFSATEIRSWWVIRQRFGYSPNRAHSVMFRQLEALTAQWGREVENQMGDR